MVRQERVDILYGFSLLSLYKDETIFTHNIVTHSPSVGHADSITAYSSDVCWNHTSVGK